jgi:hypothetical protein
MPHPEDRVARLEGWQHQDSFPSFETHRGVYPEVTRGAVLLRMRSSDATLRDAPQDEVVCESTFNENEF